MILSHLKNYPVTIAIAAIALLAHASPAISTWLQLDFAAVGDGQWWRVLTGHVTHFGAHHLFWDLLMFVVLSAACEHNHRRHFGLATLVMMAGISMAIRLFCDDISIYRGLSGLDTGLFVWFIGDQCRQSLRQRERLTTLLWLAPLVGLISKLVFEAATGQTMFVDSSTFEPLVEAHLAGAALGYGCSTLGQRPRVVERPCFASTPSAR